MESSMSNAGLMSGIAMAIFGSVPAQAQEDGDTTRGSMRHRALRHEMHRDLMQRMAQRRVMHRAMRHRMDD